MAKWVYKFSEGNASMRKLLGGLYGLLCKQQKNQGRNRKPDF